MAFQNFSNLQTVVCSNCEGKGCGECSGFGVYAISGDRNLTINLPPFIDIKSRKKATIEFAVKYGAVALVAVILLIIVWSIINIFIP